MRGAGLLGAVLVALVAVLSFSGASAFWVPRARANPSKIGRSAGCTAMTMKMVFSFNQYLEKVASLNISSLSSEEAASLAALLMSQDAETEKQLAVQEKETEKQLAVQEKETEKQLAVQEQVNETEKQLAALEYAHKIRCMESLRRRDLSVLSKRAVLEEVFRGILSEIPGNSALKSALEKITSISSNSKKCMLSALTTTKMTDINRAMLDPAFCEAAWEALAFPPETQFPRTLPADNLLYGDLSFSLHSPALNEVYLSQKSDKGSYDFFVLAAKYSNKKAETFSEEEAAAAEEDVASAGEHK
jgi:hypothetical protein